MLPTLAVTDDAFCSIYIIQYLSHFYTVLPSKRFNEGAVYKTLLYAPRRVPSLSAGPCTVLRA